MSTEAQDNVIAFPRRGRFSGVLPTHIKLATSRSDWNAAWQRAEHAPSLDPNIFRSVSGALIMRDKIGVRGQFGWRVDAGCIIPWEKDYMDGWRP